jgi:DNA-binding protein H-NS
MATYAQIHARLRRLKKRADDARARHDQTALEKIPELMGKQGLTRAELSQQWNFKHRPRFAAKSKTTRPRYRNPATGAEWNGFGRPPKWLTRDKNPARFLIPDLTSETYGKRRHLKGLRGRFGSLSGREARTEPVIEARKIPARKSAPQPEPTPPLPDPSGQPKPPDRDDERGSETIG